jgi:hypothetical protein
MQKCLFVLWHNLTANFHETFQQGHRTFSFEAKYEVVTEVMGYEDKIALLYKCVDWYNIVLFCCLAFCCWTILSDLIKSCIVCTPKRMQTIQLLINLINCRSILILLQLDSWLQTCMTYIPLLNVQWITPDDGQRDCPKHVEFHFQNKFKK